MLEVRFNTATGEVTGWWGNRHGNRAIKLKNRPNETLTYIDTEVPAVTLRSLLCTGTELIPNPDYIAPLPDRNLEAEIDALNVELINLKGLVNERGR